MRPELACRLLLLLSLIMMPAGGMAQQQDMRALVPRGALLVVDLVDGARCWQTLLDTLAPVVRRMPPQVRFFVRLAPELVEARAGVPVSELLATLLPAQAVLAVLPGPQRAPVVVVLARIVDAAGVKNALVPLADDLSHAIEGDLLVLAPSAAAIEAWRRLRPAPGQSFLDDEGGPADDSAAARPALDLRTGKAVRFQVDLAALRQLGTPRRALLAGLDAGGKLLAGPLAGALDRAKRLDGVLDLDRIEVMARIDASPLDDAALREVLAAGDHERNGPSLPSDAAWLSLDRSLAGFLRNPEPLVGAADAAQVRSAIATANLILGGGDLLADALPALGEPLWLCALPGELPDLALVVEVKSARVEVMLARAAYRLTAINGFERAQRKQVPFFMRLVRAEGHVLHVASPLIEDEATNAAAEAMAVGMAAAGAADVARPAPKPSEVYRPTLLFAHGHAVLATTPAAALRIAASLRAGRPLRVRGDVLHVPAAGLADYVHAHARTAAVGRVLDEGETLSEASTVIAVFEGLLRALASVDVALVPGAGYTELRLAARMAQ